jgi:hypothetical protein
MGIENMSPGNGRFYKEDGTTINIADLLANGAGGAFEFISDTEAHAPPSGQVFVALQLITDTVFADLSSEVVITGNTFTGASIPAGTIIYGRFNSVTLTSGSLIAYKGI